MVRLDAAVMFEVGVDKFENEHRLVPGTQIYPFMLEELGLHLQFLLGIVEQREAFLLLLFLLLFVEVEGFLQHCVILVLLFAQVGILLQALVLVKGSVLVHTELGSQGAVHHNPLVLLHELVLVDFSPVDAFGGVDGEAPFDEVDGLGRDVELGEVDCFGLYVIEDFVIGVPLVGHLPVKHLIVDHSDRPDVGAEGVGLLLQHFWGHRQAGAQDCVGHVAALLQLAQSHLFGKSQVGYFADSVMKEDVGRFEISVHGSNLMQTLRSHDVYLEPVENLFQVT